MGLLTALGRRGLRALQSGEMFGAWDDLARTVGMSEADVLALIQRARAGARLSAPEKQIMRDLIAASRGRYDDPALADSRVQQLLRGQGESGNPADISPYAPRNLFSPYVR